MRTSRAFRLLLLALPALCGPSAAWAEYSDCRTCHYAIGLDSGAPDLTDYFVQPGHHPVRVSYPSRPDYNQPGGALSGILFFDRNGNGLPDADEIQIFNTATSGSGTVTAKTRSPKKTQLDSWIIDCASCHTEHGTTAPDPGHTADYVRGAGGDRLLCTTCHNL